MRGTLACTFLCLALVWTACGLHRDTPLMAAAVRGDLQEIDRLLAAGTPVDKQDGHGFTALIAAARAGQLDSLRLLARRGANLNLRGGGNDWTPVMHALHKFRRRSAVTLIELGADVNARTRSGMTALMMAAGYGDAGSVRALLDHGADPYAENPDGSSALALAVSGTPDIDKFTVGDCQTDTVKALLERAPDLKLKDNFHAKVARVAATVGHCSEVLGLINR